jgi:biopolymer transport protein ExbD
MADVDTSGGGGHKKGSGPKTKKKSTRIDMTAMVDVAFLLLTFFVLTATMSNNAMMEMVLPPKVDPDQLQDLKIDIAENKIMTLILDENDKVYYYVGIQEAVENLDSTNYSDDGLRKVLFNHVNRMKTSGVPLCKDVDDRKPCWDPIFVFKPRKESRFKNLVDMLDELDIVNAPKYTIDKFSEIDSLIILGEYEYESDKK